MGKLDKIFDEDAELKKGEKQEFAEDLSEESEKPNDERKRLDDFLKHKKNLEEKQKKQEEEEFEDKDDFEEQDEDKVFDGVKELETNESGVKKEELIIAQTTYSAIIVPQNFEKVFDQIKELIKKDFQIEVVATKKFIP